MVHGKLWAGGREAVENQDFLAKLLSRGVRVVVSILPVGGLNIAYLRPKPPLWKLLIAEDNEELDPQYIDLAINLPAPTLIHCNAGQNRSTALAACWMMRHVVSSEDPGAIMKRAIMMRARDLGGQPRVFGEMHGNVASYGEWLQTQPGLS
jgi:hypothetical protein